MKSLHSREKDRNKEVRPLLGERFLSGLCFLEAGIYETELSRFMLSGSGY